MKQKQAEAIYDFASVLLTSIITVAVIFTFFFKISTVNGDSMRNTLHNGDQLIITAHDSDVKYGDIVIISQPNAYDEVLVKRVIATGGQTVNIDGDTHEVSVDGVVLNEPYIREKTKLLGDAFTYPVTVPEGCVFVMGDNRNESGDSRYKAVGMIDERYIVGQAVYRIGDRSLLTRD